MTAPYWTQVKLSFWKSWLVRKRKPVRNYKIFFLGENCFYLRQSRQDLEL